MQQHQPTSTQPPCNHPMPTSAEDDAAARQQQRRPPPPPARRPRRRPPGGRRSAARPLYPPAAEDADTRRTAGPTPASTRYPALQVTNHPTSNLHPHQEDQRRPTGGPGTARRQQGPPVILDQMMRTAARCRPPDQRPRTRGPAPPEGWTPAARRRSPPVRPPAGRGQ